MKSYHCKLSDGTGFNVKAISGAEAIQKALEENLGRTVVEAWLGHASLIAYRLEIPRHKAVKAKPKKVIEAEELF